MAHKERVDETIVRPVVYGNRAQPLPEKAENGHTHRWTVYIKAYNDEKLGNYIRKVQFKLHTDYSNSIRTVDHEPFEVTETGWGEFTVNIKLYLAENSERQATCSHYLALHQPVIAHENGAPVVIKETYDELVFVNPTRKMYDLLKEPRTLRFDPTQWHFDYPNLIAKNEVIMKELATQSEKEVNELLEAIKFMAQKCTELREKIKQHESKPSTAQQP